MIKKAVIGIGAIAASALLGGWFVHFLGPEGKFPTCFSHPQFFACVKVKMCEKGHLSRSMCGPPPLNPNDLND